jgi:hypothetical protein
LRENVTAYDARYVALAEARDAPLVTCDAPLATAPKPPSSNRNDRVNVFDTRHFSASAGGHSRLA